MIPTTVPSSPTSGTSALGAAAMSNIAAQTAAANATLLGLASLILEGRAMSEDDFIKSQPPQVQATNSNSSSSSSSAAPALLRELDVCSNSSSSSSASGSGERQSPKPSTSRAAALAALRQSINITTNPAAQLYSSAGACSAASSTAAALGVFRADAAQTPAQHTHQRWTQKLCQLRQSSPAAVATLNRDCGLFEQQVEAAEPELVSLAVNVEDGLVGSSCSPVKYNYEILRRSPLLPSSSSSSSARTVTDHTMHSLQSLASTCLRGSPRVAAEFTPFAPRNDNGVAARKELVQSLKTRKATEQIPIPKLGKSFIASLRNSGPKKTSSDSSSGGNISSSNAASTPPYMRQGPHSEQFLRKVGLAKGEAAEAEDHVCDISASQLNITCSRWRVQREKMEAILERGEPVCIEVYLGPSAHKILLEQWILTRHEKPSTRHAMTMPSICSAIRSQLHFSQISAWCDLIMKSDVIDDSGRVVYSNPTGAAGDLATPSNTPSSSPSYISAAQSPHGRPRLNVQYKVRAYDDTASFNSKPIPHPFPDVQISDHCWISVVLKSLPRISGGIPKINARANSSSSSSTSSCSTATPVVASVNRAKSALSAASPKAGNVAHTAATAAAASTSNSNTRAADLSAIDCDKQTCATAAAVSTPTAANSNGQQKCVFFIDEEELADCQNTTPEDEELELASHREKQLQKYRKRMLKRDKKGARKSSISSSENSQQNGFSTQQQQQNDQQQPMEEGEEEVLRNGHTPPPTPQHTINMRSMMISTGTQTQSTCCLCGQEKSYICLDCSNREDNKQPEETSCYSIENKTSQNTAGELLLQSILRTPKNNSNKQPMETAGVLNANRNGQTFAETAGNNSDATASGANNSSAYANNNSSGCTTCKRQKTQHDFENENIESAEEQQQQQGSEQNGQTALNGSSLNNESVADESIEACRFDKKWELMEEETFVNTVSCNLRLEQLYQLANYNEINKCPPNSPTTAGSNKTSHNGKLHMEEATPTAPDTATKCGGLFRTPNAGGSCAALQRHDKPTLLQLAVTPSDMVDSSCIEQACAATPTSVNNGYSHSSSGCTTADVASKRKNLPKVNLTPIFCNPAGCATSPPISSYHSLQNSQHNTAVMLLLDSNNIPVQKSFSAPTLPNVCNSNLSPSPSPCLSPRFAKQAAIYKRRSRHLSDRSDRSSLGSDEQISDEDYDAAMAAALANGGAYSPGMSPAKTRARHAAATAFGRGALLQNLEESLLHRRLRPKTEVEGFKLLLGAAGAFCPAQLTLPAAAYFYELHGQALSTPYVCEIRTPRKGYTIPRVGNIQATLLNPMGTVVRMFVIPYDMHDMPAMHQSFMRQRILAEASSNESSETEPVMEQQHTATTHERMQQGDDSDSAAQSLANNKSNASNNNNNKYRLSPNGGLHTESKLGLFITAKEMKRLRYSIHLRFQTSRSGRLMLHSDIRLLISRRTDCDTAAAHAKGVLEAPNDLVTDTVMPYNPKYSARQESSSRI